MPSDHGRAADGVPPAEPRALAWRANASLFAATVASVFLTYFYGDLAEGPPRVAVVHAAQFAGSLLAILLAHEFGHFIAARLHNVDASLPFFIPMPMLSPFGTMGAVIRMRSFIPTRRALLDIGAAGPLAGLALAIPLYAWGAAHSQVVSADTLGEGLEFGDSLLVRLLDHIFSPNVPDGMELLLSPVAYAAWAGMFVTMINLLPVGQLDGGHVAFALFGPRQNRVAQWVHRSMLVFFFVSVISFVARDLRSGAGLWHLGRHVNNSLFWLVWFEVLAVLGSFSPRRARGADDGPRSSRGAASVQDTSGLSPRTRLFATVWLALLAGVFHDSQSPVLWVGWFGGLGLLLAMEVRWGVLNDASTLVDHPPTGAEKLSPVRSFVAAVTLGFFPLLFMPTPITM